MRNLTARKWIGYTEYPDFDSAYANAPQTKSRFDYYASSALSQKKHVLTRSFKNTRFFVDEDGYMWSLVQENPQDVPFFKELNPISVISASNMQLVYADTSNNTFSVLKIYVNQEQAQALLEQREKSPQKEYICEYWFTK